jgi:superfamily II DNA or RNA helicase
MLVSGGWAFFSDRVAALDDSGAFHWLAELRRTRSLQVPKRDADNLLRALLAAPQTRPRLELPASLGFEELRLSPVPQLALRGASSRAPLEGRLAFDYGGVVVDAGAPGWAIWEGRERRLVIRDGPAERTADGVLRELGVRRDPPGSGLQLPARRLPAVARHLMARGWNVRADGRLFRPAGQMELRVSSGIDWFDLEGGASFGDEQVPLPRLLQALRRGDATVRLADGSLGLLPEEWLQRHELLVSLGEESGDALRFQSTQVALLDALLAAQPATRVDQRFRRARRALEGFAGIQPADPPPGFHGRLRDYQREGLGWLHFLRSFGFGGCLADDMGLGKTVQVLALLETRRTARAGDGPRNDRPRGPSLVVVPRSLVFNWKQEAARFVPGLRVVDHTGSARARRLQDLAEGDVVLTTYGTLRRDALLLKDARWDYVILDEAQAIKNPRTASAKAARLLDARHRLVLSGTPVENHLGELWSLFEFLNPGMLGRATRFRLDSRPPDDEQRDVLARVLRPFILRRTKEKVARDLPPRTEQTLYCEPDREQRALCNELRDHYRQVLLEQVDRRGLGRTRLRILEALLRMRQAACHPGLLDPARRQAPSAKLDVLLPRLEEVIDEGHKALVFSQFTSFLAILRERLDERGITYEYLDGRTRDRAARVGRFQDDPSCPIFLISLKAGGLGLNLTAAEYVFLLDPWWNPAAEAQAVDRTHRIGQSRRVLAYRLITRDTIEQRVLELQGRKRRLADAIVAADNRLVATLGREDLEALLA